MTKSQLVIFVPTASVVLLIILLSLLFARHHSPLIFARYVGDNGTPDRAAWLSTQVRRDDYYQYLDGPTIVPEFLQIIQKLYGASHYSLPNGLLWEDYFNNEGNGFSVKQKGDNCTDEDVKEYRRRATQSLLYSPLVFGVEGDRHSSGAPVTPAEWELFKSTHRLEKYPTAMLFIPRTNESDLVDVLKCKNYLVFLPKKGAALTKKGRP